MKIGRTFLIVITAVVLVGTVVLLNRSKANPDETEKQQSMHGRLKLVAKYEPLHLEIYADTVSTDRFAAFQIREDGKMLYGREPALSNKIDCVYLEKTMDLLTEYDLKGKILNRTVNTGFRNDYGGRKYSYVDTNGHGAFDILLEYDENSVRTAAFKLTN
jgi:hypothetical protein